MQGRKFNNSYEFFVLIQILAACGAGLLLGAVGGVFSGELVLGLLAGIFIAYLIIRRAEIGLLGILVATSSIVFEDQLPMVSVGFSLHIPDFILIGLLGVLILRWLIEPNFKFVRTPLDWPLLLFYGISLFWTFYALIHGTVEVEIARRVIRIMTYYLAFFVVTNLVRNSSQLKFLLNGFFFLSTVVAFVMIAQFALGDSVILLPGRVEELNTQGVAYSGITRILPPGISILMVSFFTSFCVLIVSKQERTAWLRLIQLGLLGFGFIFSFLRSYFGTFLVAFALMMFMLRGDELRRFIKWGMVVMVVILVATPIASLMNLSDNGLADATIARFSTIFDIDTFMGEDGSFNYRLIENDYAIREIISHPLKGLGLGADYRPIDLRLDNSELESYGMNFIHNGHLRVLLDSGLFGYSAFFALSLIFLIRGFLYWRSLYDDQIKGIVLGFTLVYLAIFLAAFVNPSFVFWSFTPVFGIIMGVNEVAYARFRQEKK